MPNLDVRFRARAAGVALWKIAKALGIGENTLFRKLRRELTAEEKQQIFDVIKKLAAEQAMTDLEQAEKK